MSDCLCVTSKVEIPAELIEETAAKGGFAKIMNDLPNEVIDSLAGTLSAVADKKRLKILFALSVQRMCVCMLAELTECSYPQCSYHLTKMKNEGLIESESLRNYLIYSITSRGQQLLDSLSHLTKR